jgi:hypothetical protein
MNKDRIQPNEFSGKNLTSIEILDGVISIGYRAYWNNKINNLTIPNSVKEIGFEAFAGNNIENLKLSENIEIIEKSTFSDNKIKILVIPQSVKIINRTAFQRNKITALIIPETVREIWTGAFYGNRISKVTIGPHVNVIKGEYDDFPPCGTFGDYGASFLELYNGNGRLGGKYTYNKKLGKWGFKFIPLNTNSLIRIWSDETIRYTEETLQELNFGWNPITGNVSMKKEDGSFGYIEMKDALNHNYRIVSENGNIECFTSNVNKLRGRQRRVEGLEYRWEENKMEKKLKSADGGY